MCVWAWVDVLGRVKTGWHRPKATANVHTERQLKLHGCKCCLSSGGFRFQILCTVWIGAFASGISPHLTTAEIQNRYTNQATYFRKKHLSCTCWHILKGTRKLLPHDPHAATKPLHFALNGRKTHNLNWPSRQLQCCCHCEVNWSFGVS